jgi:hypothetical protein
LDSLLETVVAVAVAVAVLDFVVAKQLVVAAFLSF